jgi:hypothetical protein
VHLAIAVPLHTAFTEVIGEQALLEAQAILVGL